MARKAKEEAMVTRKKLLESALQIMSDKPYAKVSMTEIARNVGLSKGAIYWHFKNKNDVLISVIEDMLDRKEKELSVELATLRSFTDTREYFKNQLRKPAHDDRIMKMHKLMLRREEWPARVRERVVAILRNDVEQERMIIEKLLIKSREEGDMRKDISTRELSLLITAAYYGIFVIQIHDFFKADFSKYVDFIFDAFEEKVLLKKKNKENANSIIERSGIPHDDFSGTEQKYERSW